MAPINVLAVVSEIFPLIKTGGLADVAGALPGVLVAEGITVRSLVPGYPQVLDALEGGVTIATLDDLFGGSASIVAAHAAGLDLFVIDAPHLYARDGDPYRGPDGRDWPDNAFRFAALSRAAALLARGQVAGYRPDVVHAHDWQAGLAPAYLHYAGAIEPPTVMTIHNLAFQGQFPAYLLAFLGLPAEAFTVHGVEYYGSIGYLKAGLLFADRITTVSPTYAAEIRTPASGLGMDGLLRTRADVLSGILNGIDTTVWDPAHDPYLATTFDADRPARRAANKAALQERFGLRRNPGKLLFGVISRLSGQKGIDLLLAALPTLAGGGGQLVVLGSGEAQLEAGLRAATAANPQDVGAQIGYDEGMAHLIQGGCDALLMPSLFEPCGLTQLCAMRYGALPVVAHVGGLCDTVIDANEMALDTGIGTGFHFAPVQTEMLEAAILRALSVWRQPDVWRRLQRNAMRTDVSWRRPAAQYAALYRELCPWRRLAPCHCEERSDEAISVREEEKRRHASVRALLDRDRFVASLLAMTMGVTMDLAAAVSAQRELATTLFDQLRHDGLDEPGVSRDPYGPGEQRAHATVAAIAQQLGLGTERDAAANLYMTLPGRDPEANRVIVGSHLDSVPHGGNFDGAAGVVAGLVAVAALQRSGIALNNDLTVMGIRAEESIWFQVSYIGSRGALAMLPDGALDVRRIDTGRTLAEHIAECGGDPDALRIGARFLDPARIAGYLELHIEQAPSLVEAGRKVAVCTGIPGNFRYPDARIEGSHDHVGLPRRFRRDAAMAGAEFAMALDHLWEQHDAKGVPMACTIGRFHTDTATHGLTIVPGAFHFSLDVRAYDETVLAKLDRQVDAIIAGIEQRRGVRFHRGPKARAAVGEVDPAIRSALERCAAELEIAVLQLGSPASHDAAAFAAAGVPMGMIFIRNENGSHNPREAMTIDDFMAGAALLTRYLVDAYASR